jgi:hypothetical protein
MRRVSATSALSAIGFDPVTNRDDDIEVVKIDLAANLPTPFVLNNRGFLGSSHAG